MLYTAYELQRRIASPLVAASERTARVLSAVPSPLAGMGVRHARAACDIVAHARPTHDRPPFGIDAVPVGAEVATVTERPALRTPFATLLHFSKPSVPAQPRVLVVCSMSGQFITLVRPTIRKLYRDYDVL